MFIDLENEVNPQYDPEEAANREKIYKNMIANEKNLQVGNSIFFNNNKNKSDYFDKMGDNEDKINQYNERVSEKLKNIANFIKKDLPEIYATNDLIV
jgi:NurA-like 5'-3' nuclease